MEDLNGDGFKKDDEDGIADVQVDLYDADDGAVDSTTTRRRRPLPVHGPRTRAITTSCSLPRPVTSFTLPFAGTPPTTATRSPTKTTEPRRHPALHADRGEYDPFRSAGLFELGGVSASPGRTQTRNGIRDSGEGFLPRSRSLLDVYGNVLDSAATSMADGSYAFDGPRRASTESA